MLLLRHRCLLLQVRLQKKRVWAAAAAVAAAVVVVVVAAGAVVVDAAAGAVVEAAAEPGAVNVGAVCLISILDICLRAGAQLLHVNVR